MRKNAYIVYIVLFLVFCVLWSCKPKMTCSAYQSYFILDKEVSEELYSPFGKDSLPKSMHTNKDKHGISENVDQKLYEKKHYFIPMKLVPPKPLEDDSAAADSVGMEGGGEFDNIEEIEPTNNINPEGDKGKDKEKEETPEDIDLDDEDLWDDEDETDEEDDGGW